ncbi:hypothetical protein [Bacillus sp. FJAT-26390]|uniref:hypothetical protein n=1 Tax=Bacillus sp. FJAT-26390 TaxID=1743142 RepID=UPI000807A996|nr:hypothetical protein [Bacillus sp. FJAT-26390]OBZ11210.1 hypothetical protein A7975_19840 [Bacillus sp. FJAT-26390]
MTTTRKLLVLTSAALALALTGCATGTAPKPQTKAEVKQQAHMLHDPNIIPSEGGPKLHTTNEHGKTTYGMGTSVYSMIGSSGLHANGFSAHLESRLSGIGIPDVRVFVFDDTVVLAAEKHAASASQYDSVQRKLLDQTEGLSGKGYSPENGLGGISGTDKSSHDNLAMAASQIKTFMGGDVKVLTVTGAKAVKLIEQIRTDAMAKNISPDKVANGIRELLRLVKAEQSR